MFDISTRIRKERKQSSILNWETESHHISYYSSKNFQNLFELCTNIYTYNRIGCFGLILRLECVAA